MHINWLFIPCCSFLSFINVVPIFLTSKTSQSLKGVLLIPGPTGTGHTSLSPRQREWSVTFNYNYEILRHISPQHLSKHLKKIVLLVGSLLFYIKCYSWCTLLFIVCKMLFMMFNTIHDVNAIHDIQYYSWHTLLSITQNTIHDVFCYSWCKMLSIMYIAIHDVKYYAWRKMIFNAIHDLKNYPSCTLLFMMLNAIHDVKYCTWRKMIFMLSMT